MAAEKKRSFWDIFTLVKDGKVKNTFLLYAFALSFVFLAAYGLAFLLLIDPIEHLLINISPVFAGIMEWLLPSIAGTLICLGCQKPARNKALAPAAFVFLDIIIAAMAVMMFVSLEPQDYALFFSLFAQVCLAPLILGGISTTLVWRHHAQRTDYSPAKEHSFYFRKDEK